MARGGSDLGWLVIAGAIHAALFVAAFVLAPAPNAPLLRAVWEVEAPLEVTVEIAAGASLSGRAESRPTDTPFVAGSTREVRPEVGRSGGARTKATDDAAAEARAPQPEEEYSPLELSEAGGWASVLAPDAWLPVPAPTKAPLGRKLSRGDVTAMMEGDLAANDRELGLRQPTTQWILAALASELRLADVPDGTRIHFALELSGDGHIASMRATTQSAGSGGEGDRVARAVVAQMADRPLEMGSYRRGARVGIATTVVEAYPSGATEKVTVEVKCPKDEKEAVAKELRDIRSFHPWPQDPNQEQPMFAPVGGKVFDASPTAVTRPRCFRLWGTFDLSDIGANLVRQVRSSVTISPP